MRRNALFLAWFAMMLSVCLAQTMLTNDAIVKMVKAGLGEDILLSTIKAQPGQYATSADDLIALKKAGIPDKVISAMIDKGTAPSANPLVSAASPAASPAAAPGPMGTPPPVVSEVGVYYNKSGAWADLSPEIVNAKTGGTLKKIGTVGRGKGDINGHVNGLHSPNPIKPPVELLIYTPEGTAITEYQLLRLRDQKDSREFRTTTGGSTGGAIRDLLPLESKKVAPRTYQITLTNLGPGEYGLLPPVVNNHIGKIYSFRVVD